MLRPPQEGLYLEVLAQVLQAVQPPGQPRERQVQAQLVPQELPGLEQARALPVRQGFLLQALPVQQQAQHLRVPLQPPRPHLLRLPPQQPLPQPLL